MVPSLPFPGMFQSFLTKGILPHLTKDENIFSGKIAGPIRQFGFFHRMVISDSLLALSL